jgi:hypothetical protein
MVHILTKRTKVAFSSYTSNAMAPASAQVSPSGLAAPLKQYLDNSHI